MRIRKYPPEIKGNTVSNLILVDNYDYDKEKKEWCKDRDYFGYTEPFNSRDVFLNVNVKNGWSNKTHQVSINVIIHEVTHNVLTKYIGEKASRELDNLFYKKVYRKKLKKLLFGIIEFTLKEQKKKFRTKKGKKYIKLDDDFWLKRFSH